MDDAVLQQQQQQQQTSMHPMTTQDEQAAQTDGSYSFSNAEGMHDNDVANGGTFDGNSGETPADTPAEDAFTYLSFGGTFRRTIGLFMDNYDLFGILSAISLVPYGVCYSTVTLLAIVVRFEEDKVPDFHPTHIPLVTLVVTMELGLYALFTVIGRAAMFRAVALLYIQSTPNGNAPNQTISWQSCVRESFQKNLVPLMGASLITIFAMLGIAFFPYLSLVWALVQPNLFTVLLATGLVGAGLAYGLYVYIGWVLAGPAIVFEQQGHRHPSLSARSCMSCESSKKGLRRSWELVNDSRCYVLSSLFILYIAHTIVRRLFHTIFTSSGSVNDVLFSIPGILAEFLPKFVFFPLHSILEVVLYLNLRVGREALNRESLQAEFQNDFDDTVADASPAAGMTDVGAVDSTDDRAPGTGASWSANNMFGFSGGEGSDAFSFRQPVNTDYRQVPLMDGEQQPDAVHQTSASGGAAFSPPTLPESSNASSDEPAQHAYV